MGGGAAMRAAAKAAGAGILNNGLRIVVPDYSASSASRKVIQLQSMSVSTSANAVKTDISDPDTVPVHRPCWEFEDWELAGGDEELSGLTQEGFSRLVFGAAPSLDEAQEATSELKDVLDKAYLSSPVSPRSWHSQSEVSDTKPLRSSEKVLAASSPKHAMEAFKFLNESPAVQNVVASIACDPNVWNAVLLNPTLQEYIQSQNIGAFGVDQCENELTGTDILSPRSHQRHDGADDPGESNPSIGIVDYLRELKLTVVDMLSNLGDYFQILFGGYDGENNSKGTMSSFVDKALGPSLLGLAIMVILVVVLKRAH
ncbi:OLC1v1023017C1 [Oldenlandia corymbosa var. corymbosa]|uniref:OLC1v1023017C1 n=1 Tax=Oldenlandia corymbosa var. corymbosa TaxID=529605 RepID=A0AAV1C1S2_OLDCO|nr:OLC1v1023017C1 [Oldenlandia corymbosa var. corymbosa]